MPFAEVIADMTIYLLVQPQYLAGNETSDGFDVLERKRHAETFLQNAWVVQIQLFVADLAGISPYFNSPGVSLDASPPDSCTVASATYLIRHSNIYANDFDYENTLAPFISKLANFSSKGDFVNQSALAQFAFLANWTSPITNETEQVEKLTPSGADSATAFGQIVRALYPTLLPSPANFTGNSSYNIWTSESERTIATANAFITGMFPGSIGINSTTPSGISLVVVPEGEDESANSLTPHVCVGHSNPCPSLKRYSLPWNYIGIVPHL